MADEEKKRRRFDPGMLGGDVPRIDPNITGVLGQMFGGIGAGLGQGFANKMSERVTLAAAALQGILACPDPAAEVDGTPNTMTAESIARTAVACADAVLKRLEEVPDPRFPEENMPGVGATVATLEKP